MTVRDLLFYLHSGTGRVVSNLVRAFLFLMGIILIFFGEQPDSKVESKSASPLPTSTDESLILSEPTILRGRVFIGVLWRAFSSS